MHLYRILRKFCFITIENVKKRILRWYCVKNKCVCVFVCTFSVLTYPETYIQEIAIFLFLRHCSYICISGGEKSRLFMHTVNKIRHCMYSRAFIYFPYTKDRILVFLKTKKGMVKAAGFEPRIVQLWLRNLTDSASSFRATHRHIKCTLKLTPWLPRWPPYCKMTDLHLDHFLYLLHSCTHYYQSRGLPLRRGNGGTSTSLHGGFFLPYLEGLHPFLD